MNPRVGIVIVSYNASLAVRIMLAGLRRSKNQTPYSVLLVDNASDKAERTVIRNAFDRHAGEAGLDWKYIQLEKNLGFSGGNNVGIRKFLKSSEITHICLLNSDVIVPDFWLDRLVEKQCDAISAVTNKADSEQCIPVDYQLDLASSFDPVLEGIPSDVFERINSFAQKRYTAWYNNIVKTGVTFFCVLLTRTLIKKAGLLDEKFYPGGYEDDDYCARINAMGQSTYLSRDVFIHHFGSASFGQLQQNYFNKKAAKNREYLERKHNFTVRRRPEKPIISYLQDISFALKGNGDRSLQDPGLRLYGDNLSMLIHHYEQEFSAIHGHLIHCGHPIPDQIIKIVNDAASHGNCTEYWTSISREIKKAFHHKAPDAAVTDDIRNRLENIAAAVYAKAECNRVMYEFLCSAGVFSNGQPSPERGRIKKFIWMFRKGISFIWGLKGIVFFGGFPYAERKKDGYFQRILSIDNLFRDRWRIYIDHMVVAGKNFWYDRPTPRVIVFHINNHKHHWFMKLVVALCVMRCRKIYFHSVLRMNDSGFGAFMKWPLIKKIIDIHGAVPEEFRYHNDFFSAGIYDRHERLAVRKAHCIIVVSRTIHNYFRQKYRELLNRGKIIILPIFPDVHSLSHDKTYGNAKPIVVYAGGTHKWQQVPKMLDAIAATTSFCTHKIFCPDPSQLKTILPPSLQNNPSLTIDSKSFDELLNIYEHCHYGFILREDNVLNHVACPTKLVEYVAMGIVPIVDCEEMGDFKSLGMQFIPLRDFVAGNLPDEATRNAMATINYEIHTRLQEINQQGKQELQQAFGSNKHKGIGGTLKRKAGQLLPSHTLPGKLARKLWRKTSQADAAGVTLYTREDKIINGRLQASTMQAIPGGLECDILVQVDNFLVGGLENVVLDLNSTLEQSGWKVLLLILGEAGSAAERAKEKRLKVLIRQFNTADYRNMLKVMNPKMVLTHYSIHGAAVCSEFKIPLIQVIHNTYMWFSPEQAQQFSEAARQATALIAVSDYVKKYSVVRLGMPPEKCVVIPNGIDTGSFLNINKEKERNKLRRKHGIAEDDFIFLNVGSITHQKNQMSAVRSFHTFLRYCPDSKLVILGKLYEQSLWAGIEEYITANHLEKHIIYAGESNNPPAYYAMADAFLHSAFFEGGQLSLLEAIVANLPIVTSEIGFAKHFRGRKGIRLVKPPIEIIDYRGAIWEMKSTPAFERDLALQMLKTYTEGTRPDFGSNFINMLDKEYTYKIYDELIRRFLESGKLFDRQPASWPDQPMHRGEMEVTLIS